MKQQTFVVTGLAFGDEGKGTTVDYLTRRHGASLVVRHNGGAQAGHNVVASNGEHHCFAQFGSGTFAGANTYLSRYMVVHPGAMLVEARHLERVGVKDPLSRLMIDMEALVITPYHQAYNRLLELSRGANRHGTCGVGVGATVSDAYDHPNEAIRMEDLAYSSSLRKKLEVIRNRKLSEAEKLIGPKGSMSNEFLEEMAVLTYMDLDDYIRGLRLLRSKVQVVDQSYLTNALKSLPTVIFEGAQGVLLDEWHGFHPHTTYSTTTHANALTLLKEGDYQGEVVRLGILRTYLTRHGQGPFPTQTDSWSRPEPHNSPKGWQGGFRWGQFDAVLARYAIAACKGVDGIVLTHMDSNHWSPCDSYSKGAEEIRTLPVNHDSTPNGFQAGLIGHLKGIQPNYTRKDNPTESDFLGVEDMLGASVVLGSNGPTSEDKVSYDKRL